jgi:uncharacterized protein (DUF433 family)
MVNLMHREGSVFILKTDVAVWRILMLLEDGLSEDQIHDFFKEDLPVGSVKSAQVYYSVHREELDAEIAAGRKKAAAIRKKKAAAIRRKKAAG